jgi:hypothetical protein
MSMPNFEYLVLPTGYDILIYRIDMELWNFLWRSSSNLSRSNRLCWGKLNLPSSVVKI